MFNALLADLLLLLHLGYVLFVLFGALLLLRSPRWAWSHLPAVLWAAWVNLAGRVCPLTPWEQQLRHAAGQGGYSGGFLEHYIKPWLYPESLEWDLGLVIGLGALGWNLMLYTIVIYRYRRGSRATGDT